MSPQASENSAWGPQADLSLAHQIKQAALETKGVATISAGRWAEVATRWLGEKVVGVAVDKVSVEVHVVARYPSGFPVANLAERPTCRHPLGQTANRVLRAFTQRYALLERGNTCLAWPCSTFRKHMEQLPSG